MEATKIKVGPADHGRRMSLADFAEAESEPGHLYELAGGVIQVVDVPGLPHGSVVDELDLQVAAWRLAHRELVAYVGTGDRCVLRLAGMQSERHPDLAIYLTPAPDPVNPWERWVPDIVVEVVSEGGEVRDYQDKRREYLAAGVREYWIIDPQKRAMLVLLRAADVWREHRPSTTYTTPLLPGFSLDIVRLLGVAR
jgi:Uma2 family endonuclease